MRPGNMMTLRLLRFPLAAGHRARLATLPSGSSPRHLFTTTARRAAQDDDKPSAIPPSEPAPAAPPSEPTPSAPTSTPDVDGSKPLASRYNRITPEGLLYTLPTRHSNAPTGPPLRYGARTGGAPIPLTVTVHPGAVALVRTGAKSLHLSSLWLRDACPCPSCVDPDSGQKTFSTADLPAHPPVASAAIDAATGALRVVWAGDGGHVSEFPAETVAEWMVDGGFRTPQRLPLRRTLWDRATYEGLLAAGETRVGYEEWMGTEAGFWRGFEALMRTGLIFVSGVPGGREDAVEGIAARIGEMQTTFYGRTWDVRSKPRAENVAYTSQFLGLHQDLMYHDPVPRLQLLHCLENGCEGGESIFSDGVRAAYEMEVTPVPGLWDSLTKPAVHFHYKKGGHYYEMRRETIHVAGNLIDGTHWSPPFQAPFRREAMEDTAKGPVVRVKSGRRGLEQWHESARLFQRSLESPKNMVEMKLSPGECVIFDNWRVLHGRREFKPGQGHRWLKGTYITDQVTRGRETELQRRDPQRFGKRDRRDELDTHLNRAKLAAEERTSVVSLLESTPR